MTWGEGGRYASIVAELVTITSEGVTLRQEIADAGARIAAGIVDLVVVFVLAMFLIVVVTLIASVDIAGLGGFLAGLVLGGVLLLVLGYDALFHQFAHGQTPGKMLLGIRVVANDGYPPSFLALVLRALLWPVDVFPIFVMPIGIFVIAFTPRRQRLGDLVAGTVVVHVRDARPPVQPWPKETWSGLAERTLPLSPLSLARLDGRDVEFLRQLLTRTSLESEQRRRLLVEAARHYAERLELGPFADARIVLRELYLFAREFRTEASA